MKKVFLLISIICIWSAFTFAQKTIGKLKKPKTVQTASSQNKSSQADLPIKILYKPRAAYPNQDKGTVCIQGTVRLRVEFLDSGEIGKIAVVSGLPYGASENSIEAAKKIKFNPALKNGKSVTVFKVVEFSFSIY